MAWPPIHSAHALVIFLMALLLALPLPLPFTNTLPAYAIIFTAASMMEEDDRVIWIAYLVTLVTLVYFALTSGTIVTLSVKYYHQFWHWFLDRP